MEQAVKTCSRASRKIEIATKCDPPHNQDVERNETWRFSSEKFSRKNQVPDPRKSIITENIYKPEMNEREPPANSRSVTRIVCHKSLSYSKEKPEAGVWSVIHRK